MATVTFDHVTKRFGEVVAVDDLNLEIRLPEWVKAEDAKGEVDGKRIETSRTLGSSGIWGIIPVNIKPIIAVRF